MKPRSFVVVPFKELSPDALTGLLEAYVSREGTDYGHTPPPTLAEKTAQVRRQLEQGDAVIVFDPEVQSCNIIPRHDLPPDAINTSAETQ
jgi:uncharacterized protein YheU (UPF0270 family)